MHLCRPKERQRMWLENRRTITRAIIGVGIIFGLIIFLAVQHSHVTQGQIPSPQQQLSVSTTTTTATTTADVSVTTAGISSTPTATTKSEDDESSNENKNDSTDHHEQGVKFTNTKQKLLPRHRPDENGDIKTKTKTMKDGDDGVDAAAEVESDGDEPPMLSIPPNTDPLRQSIPPPTPSTPSIPLTPLITTQQDLMPKMQERFLQKLIPLNPAAVVNSNKPIALKPIALTPSSASSDISHESSSETRSRISRLTRVQEPTPKRIVIETEEQDEIPTKATRIESPSAQDSVLDEAQQQNEELDLSDINSATVAAVSPLASSYSLGPIHNLTLVYDFGACGCTGWSMEAMTIILGLAPYIENIGIIAGEGCWCPGVLQEDIEILENMRTAPIDEWDADGMIDIFISHKPPQRYPHFPYKGVTRVKNEPLLVIGRSMTEVARIPAAWAQAISTLVDEVWVPSRHSYEAFQVSGVPEVKMKVIGEPIDARLFRLPLPDRKITSFHLPSELISSSSSSDPFTFLSIFKLEARKNWHGLVRTFLSEFDANENVKLVLHTYLFGESNSHDVEKIRRKLDQFIDSDEMNEYFRQRDFSRYPSARDNIIIISDEISLQDMPYFYRSFSAFVLPTHGEGWCLPMMEAMAMELPSIATGYGGQMEFMTPNNSYLIPISSFVPAEGRDFAPGSMWVNPDEKKLAQAMRHVYSNYDQAKEVGKRARRDVMKKFSMDAITKQILERVEELIPFIEQRREERDNAVDAAGDSDSFSPLVRGSYLSSAISPHSPSSSEGLRARRGEAQSEESSQEEEREKLRQEQAVKESYQIGWTLGREGEQSWIQKQLEKEMKRDEAKQMSSSRGHSEPTPTTSRSHATTVSKKRRRSSVKRTSSVHKPQKLTPVSSHAAPSTSRTKLTLSSLAAPHTDQPLSHLKSSRISSRIPSREQLHPLHTSINQQQDDGGDDNEMLDTTDMLDAQQQPRDARIVARQSEIEPLEAKIASSRGSSSVLASLDDVILVSNSDDEIGTPPSSSSRRERTRPSSSDVAASTTTSKKTFKKKSHQAQQQLQESKDTRRRRNERG